MSVLIKGLTIPIVGVCHCVIAFDNNRLLITDVCGNSIFDGNYVEIPTSHGRLIDADRLIEIMQDTLNGYRDKSNDGNYIERLLVETCKKFVEHCPTVVEAEE